MSWYNFHTHTEFCDGSEHPEKYVEVAINKNMRALGFSGHAPLNWGSGWCIKENELQEYCSTVQSLKKKYKEKINIYLGLEIDFIPGLSKDFDDIRKKCELDYCIGSVHLVRREGSHDLWFIDGPDKNYIEGLKNVFDNDVKLAVENYYRQIMEMVITQKPDVIGHLDKIKMNNKGRYFKGDEQWYKDMVLQTLDVIAESGKIMEVNTRGIYKGRTKSLFPENWIIGESLKRKIPVTINSDTHKPPELINYFNEAAAILKQIGYNEIYFFNGKSWIVKAFDENGIC
ncbi:MAG: histidinol-phosphatase [Bacteroidales bacterium]|nr:histidinol-phosphatase [Bacteroidales bacterium]